jgi:hypothetical protein
VGRLKGAEPEGFHPAPVYLTALPLAVLLGQVAIADPATAFSRQRAIRKSAEIIRDLEAHHAREGRYRISLAAVWKDYSLAVVGIERYEYAPHGDAHDLFFEQPRFLFDDFGAREFVVYNPRDEQAMISHASWILILSREELARSPGWFAVHDIAAAPWKRFLFD